MRPVPLMGEDVQVLKGLPVYNELRVLSRRGIIFSAWKPSPEEKQSLVDGKPVWCAIRGSTVPAFSLIAGDQSEVVPTGDHNINSILSVINEHDNTESRQQVQVLVNAARDAYHIALGDAILLRLKWMLAGALVFGWAWRFF